MLVVMLLVSGHSLAAEGPVQARWEYRISIPDAATGNVHVELSLRGLQDAVTKFSFSTTGHRDPVTNVVGGPHTPLKTTADGIEFEVDGDESFSYDVHVEREAFVAGQKLSHVGTDFALFKAESIALEYRYSYFEGTTFENKTTILLQPPPNWEAKGPWKALGPTTYELPAGHVLPRGYVVFGDFLAQEDRVAGEKVVHYVRLGKVAEYEKGGALFEFIAKATPYYAAVYGPGVEQDVLVVNAPDPMFRGGLGGDNSFFVHESADLRTVAHEYAHVFQLFGTEEDQGSSSIWLNEGDADYHSALALFAADVWSPQQVDDFLAEAAKDKNDPDLRNARLPDAAYGTALERFAYHKGALVLRALDELYRTRTGGDVSLSDLLRVINKKHGDPSAADAAVAVTNQEIRAEAEKLLGGDLSEFFAQYVYGTDWPLPYAPFVPEGQLVVSQLTLTPARAAPGDAVRVSVTVTNRGTNEIKRFVDLLLDDERIASENVSLAVGAATTLSFDMIAPEPGDHEVRVLYERANLRSLSPANLTITRASFVPATLRANEPVNLLVFIENTGERPGTGRVEARLAGTLLSATTETVLDGNETTALTLPLNFAAPGQLTLTLALITPDNVHTQDERISVGEADGDGDGVPDSSDAYPNDARLFERSVANDVKSVPALGMLALLAAIGLAARRRRA